MHTDNLFPDRVFTSESLLGFLRLHKVSFMLNVTIVHRLRINLFRSGFTFAIKNTAIRIEICL